MPPLGDLALMIQSRYPFIAVETSEEDRLETTLSRVAGDLRVPFFVWTVTNGLHRYGLPNAIYDSQQPLKGLNNVAAMTGEAIFLMKDLHRYLADAAVARKCLDLAPAFGHDRRVIVMSAVKVELPPELEPLTARFTLDLPGAEELKTFGIEPGRGILLLGVQGAGKTLVARAVAREWGLPLLKMEPARLYDKYIGETEKNLDKALRMAEQMAPCVLMIDELEKGLSYNPGGDADAGLSKRVFGRLLAWLQDRKAPVFVVATCNDIGQLPPELTRKGRFDEIFFVDLPNADERKEIFAVHLRKRKRDPKLFDLAGLAAASDGFSGAEIEQAVVAGLYTAFSRGVEVSSPIIVEELKATKPLSVTRAETIGALREWARDRTVMAS